MITLKVNETRYQEIRDAYDLFVVKRTKKDDDYVDFIAKVDNVTVTGYLSKRKTKTITFSGVSEKKEAARWDESVLTTPEKVKKEVTPNKGWVDLNEQIGSDEVGVGDFLLPMIVVAVYVKKEDIALLKQLGVKDSKKLNDTTIREIGKVLAEKLEYSKLTLTNAKYNEMIMQEENLNSLKAKMHNRALCNLVDKHPDVVGVYVDQFCSKETYYSYFDDPEEHVVRDISFHTKGESLYPSVAAASIIARYSFLLEADKLFEQYKLKFPYGASKKVDEFAHKFVEKYGMAELNKIAKKNFANYKELMKVN